MDIFYKDTANIGALSVVTLPKVSGQANLLVWNVPAATGQTFISNVIITSLAYNQSTNTQFQQSLENVIYVYSFGDKMGTLALTGLAFIRGCSDSKNGITELMHFYRDNRVSRNVARLQLTFADVVIRGYLVAMDVTTKDASSGIHSFSMQLKTIPAAFRDNRSAGGGGATEEPEYVPEFGPYGLGPVPLGGPVNT